LTLEPEQWFRLGGGGLTAGADAAASGGAAALGDAEVEQLIDARIAARKGKDFAESDRIRDLLAASGVIVEDKPGGKSTWRRA
jgi:cysteinyl-tRNA synthetase